MDDLEQQLRSFAQPTGDGPAGRGVAALHADAASARRARALIAGVAFVVPIMIVGLVAAYFRSSDPVDVTTAGQPAQTAPVPPSACPGTKPQVYSGEIPGGVAATADAAVDRFAEEAGVPRTDLHSGALPAYFAADEIGIHMPGAGLAGDQNLRWYTHTVNGRSDFALGAVHDPHGWFVQIAVGCPDGLAIMPPAPPSTNPFPSDTPCGDPSMKSEFVPESVFREEFANELQGPDAALHEMVLKFRNQDVTRFENEGICFVAVDVGPAPTASVNVPTPPVVVVRVKDGTMTAAQEADVLATFADPSRVAILRTTVAPN
ncbi:MAG: hypothetical protein H0W08_09090 [Acidobacteria bacterium]|nr:hypothetical protein [Acidobacteriota bacterium]